VASHSIGKIFVELDLDADRYTKGQQRLLKDAKQTSLSIEENFRKLQIKSSAQFNLMRQKAINANNMIANSAKATANDRVRAERAMTKKLSRLNDQQYGHQVSTFDKLKKHWQAYSVAAIGAIYSISRAMTKSLEEFKNYETALIDMAKVTDQSFGVMDDKIMSLNSNLGDSTDLMKGYYQVISAGVTEPKAALELLITAAKASKAAHLDQSEVIKALTKVMRGFAGEIKSTEEAADLLFTTEKLGQTTVAELVPIIGDMAKISKEVGISHTEMAAALALITQTAGSTSNAATQYRGVLLGLLRPNEKLTELVTKYGYESGVAMVKSLGFSRSLNLIKRGAADASIQIGKLFRSSEGMLGLASLSESDFERYNELIVEMGEGAGSSAEAFDRFLESAQAVDDELETNFKRLLIEIGEYADPFAKAIKTMMSDALGSLAAGIDKVDKDTPIALLHLAILLENLKTRFGENAKATGEWTQIIDASGEKVWILTEYVEAYNASLEANKKANEDVLTVDAKRLAAIEEHYKATMKQVKAEEKLSESQLQTYESLEKFLELNSQIDDQAKAVVSLDQQYAKIEAKLKALELAGYDVAEMWVNLEKWHANSMDEIVNKTDDATASIDDIMKDIGGLDFKGTSFGNELADGINNAMISIQSLNTLFEKHAKIQGDINKLIEEGKEEEAAKAQIALDDSYFQAQISGYRQLFGTVSQLFDENSKEREALHKIEMGFAVMEMAMTAKKMVMETAAMISSVANSSTVIAGKAGEAVAGAVVGVTNQGTGDPYTAFGRIAAMIALMGSVLAMGGIAFGGGGGGGSGGSEAATTGTVLGDPTKSSESMQKSLDMAEDWHIEEYTELIGIHNELIDLNKNITGIVSNIVRNFGDFDQDTFKLEGLGDWGKANEKFMELNEKIIDKLDLGGFAKGDMLTVGLSRFMGDIAGKLGNKIFGGEVKIKGAGIVLGREFAATVGDVLEGVYPSVEEYADWKKDGGWFHDDKKGTKYGPVDAEIERLFDKIYGNIINMLVYLAEGFDYSAEQMSEVLAYEFANVKLDLKGLSGEEITKKISAWISTMGDTAVEALFSEVVGKYQEVDEGMLETAMRLVMQKEILLSALEMTGQGFDATSGSAIDFSQDMIALSKDFETLMDDISNYYDKFFSEEEQFADLTEGLTSKLALQNMELPKTRDGYRDLVEGLKKGTEAENKRAIALMENADAADAYYDYLEDINDELNSVYDTAIMADMNDYEAALYEINQKYIDLASQLSIANLLFDEQGKLTELGAKALGAYNLEIQGLTKSVEDSINSMLDTVFEDIAMEGLTEYEQQLYRINEKYKDIAQQLIDANLLYDEQGNLTDIATRAIGAYNIEIQGLTESVEDSINSMLDAVFEDIAMEGLTEYEQQLYRINEKYKDIAQQLIDANLLYDEQGNLTDIATRAIGAYNLEIQRLANVILDTIDQTKRQLSTMGMDSNKAGMLDIAARYGIAPSAVQSGAQDILNWYMNASSTQIAGILATYGVSIDQFNADMITLGNSLMTQGQEHHQEAQAKRDEAQTKRNEMINSLDSAIDGIDSMLADLSPTGSLAPVQSAEAFQLKYDELIDKIRTSDDPGKYVSELQSFLPDYLSFSEAFGGDYKDLFAGVQEDLEGLNVEFKTERDYLKEIAGSTGNTAAGITELLGMGIPITFNTAGLGENAVTFLQGLQEIVSLVGWNSPFTIDFVSNYSGFATMPFLDFVNVVDQIAAQVPGGWHAQLTMDTIMSFENWDDTSIEERLATWEFIKGTYGWHSTVTFEFIADMVDSVDGLSWEDIMTILPDDVTKKEMLIWLNNNTGMTPSQLASIFGSDFTADMHLSADLIWPEGGFLDVLVGAPVTIAKFGNTNADTWTSQIHFGLVEIWWVLKDIEANDVLVGVPVTIAKFGNTNADTWTSQIHFGLVEIWKVLKDIERNTRNLNRAFNIPGYAAGGLTSGLSFAGEKGAEYIVPTYEPERSSFLQSVGADPEAIGKSVAKYIMRSGMGGEKEVHIHLEIDGQEIRNPVIMGLQGRDADLIDAVRKAA